MPRVKDFFDSGLKEGEIFTGPCEESYPCTHEVKIKADVHVILENESGFDIAALYKTNNLKVPLHFQAYEDPSKFYDQFQWNSMQNLEDPQRQTQEPLIFEEFEECEWK